MKRQGPRLGEARGTRMLPPARATRPPLPPGRLKWGTAASARPEGKAAGTSETGASAWRNPVDGERLHPRFRRPQCGNPGASRFSPQSPTEHGAHGLLCKRGPGNQPKNPPSGLRSTGGRPGYGFDSHPVTPKVSFEYQLRDAPACLGRGPRSGSLCRWQLCSLPFRIPAFALSGLGNTGPPT